MTKFESRLAPGDAELGLLGPPVIVNHRGENGAVPSRPVPDLEIPDRNGSAGEPRFRALTEHEFDVVAVVSSEGRFIFVSASAERLFGYDPSGVIGQDAFGLFDSLSIEPVRALFNDLVARRRLSVSLEIQTVRADGKTIDLDVTAANHLDDPIGGIVVNIRDITDRKRLEQRIHSLDERQATIIESLADGVMTVDAKGVVVGVNESFEVMFEAPRVRVVGRQLDDLLAISRHRGIELLDGEGSLIDGEQQPTPSVLRHGRRSVGVVWGLRREGRPPMWVRVNTQAIRDSDGRVTGAVASFSDITSARQSADELQREEQFLQVLLGTLEEGIVACDAEGRITVCNPAARRLLGLEEGADPTGRSPFSFQLRRPDGAAMEPEENPLIQAMSGEQLREVEVILDSDERGQRKVSVNGEALVDEGGRMLGAVVAIHDVTEQKLNEERLAELALHDPLTGLANRTLLAERLQEAIDGLAQRPTLPDGTEGRAWSGVAVFLLDLDEFKEINDVLGHDVGDDMLIAVARRLSAIVRPSDTVARLGGDEFVVVCAIESGEEEMLSIAERISTALARPYRIDGRTLSVLASVGGVFADNPDTDPSRLLSRADDAMYGVKWSRRRQRRSMTE